MNMRLRAATVLLLTGLAVSGTLHATERQPFSVLDLVTLHRVADPAVSPDGKRLTFTLRSTDLSA
ncbi:MAG: PD40 domain-containing protein, partial [Proteobacteria bacterium]|nr:PD40 domain-containing protein [Pseudomonadota bacterium]